MKQKDILEVAVRLLGLLFLYHALQVLPMAVVQFCAAVPHPNAGRMLTSLLSLGWPLLLAYWLLRGAPFIVRIAYPDVVATAKTGAQVEGAPGQQTDA